MGGTPMTYRTRWSRECRDGNEHKSPVPQGTRTWRLLRQLTAGVLAGCVVAAAGSAQTPDVLRVMQWNIHNTLGTDGVCNPDRTASTIAAQNPHVVSLNEVKYFAGACSFTFDMSERLQSLLQAKTGVTWYRHYVRIGNNTWNVLLSRYPLVSSSSTLLSYDRGVAYVAISVNGRTVHLFSTHVEYYTAAWRTIQINEAIRWIQTFSEPRIVMGDFNTTPGTSDYSLAAAAYEDAWASARSAGLATSYNGTGNTHGGSRFDYVFYSRVAALSLRSVDVPDTRVNGVRPSDHDPVIATFAVGAGLPPPSRLRVLR
jgi:endonuclease/exonuclease/phosphatase family metal-dependent hydrolase